MKSIIILSAIIALSIIGILATIQQAVLATCTEGVERVCGENNPHAANSPHGNGHTGIGNPHLRTELDVNEKGFIPGNPH